MKPIVHGLERKYAGRVDFVYLDTGDARTKDIQQRMGFEGSPQIILLKTDGTKLQEWIGKIVPESELIAGLDRLLAP